ncbi:MAG: S-layer homology domain-containing protein, partial [Oscillospiraceae bacterium]|nr:S-layer homology domain-containing protein [Oscillospiraceae bacterium]
MRNFKKLTALVLVFVMALALVVPYASAVTYDDQEDINPDFAADLDLLYELQIIIGSDNLFSPKDTATRAELIKTAYVIEHGTYANPADADRYKTTNVPFTDYDSSKWYAGHVNWAYIEKIINGTSATTFEPERDITGFETLKVLLGVIGFIPEYEGYDQGSEWANRVLALADKTGLIEGIENVDFSRPITREVMAHAIYNTLFTNIVSYVKDTHEISNTTSKTVVEEYFGLQTLDDARVLANRYVGIDGKTKTGGNTIETDIYGKIAVSADVAADFELIGRSVTLYVKTEPQVAPPGFKITKLYGKPVLNNADELIQVTADDLTASGTVSIVVSGTTYTSASVAALSNNTLYINFLEDVDTNLNLVVGDNPVDLIVDGNTIKAVLAYDYTFVKLAVASGKVTATEFDT